MYLLNTSSNKYMAFVYTIQLILQYLYQLNFWADTDPAELIYILQCLHVSVRHI